MRKTCGDCGNFLSRGTTGECCCFLPQWLHGEDLPYCWVLRNDDASNCDCYEPPTTRAPANPSPTVPQKP